MEILREHFKKGWKKKKERMGTIKDTNDKELTEAEEIKKRWQEYSELYKKNVSVVWITKMVWSFT